LIKKIAGGRATVLLIFILLLFACFIALTQETDEDLPVIKLENEFYEDDDYSNSPKEKTPEWIKDARWFRSNSGGMALEEIPSRLTALRNEYALYIGFAEKEELPQYLHEFYDEPYFIETRVLYEKGIKSRTQWIFKDYDGTSRLVAVILEKETVKETQTEVNETEEEPGENFDDEIIVKEIADNVKEISISGFIEIYDKNSLLSAEYKYSQDGSRSRTDYIYKNGLLLRSSGFLWEEYDNDADAVSKEQSVYDDESDNDTEADSVEQSASVEQNDSIKLSAFVEQSDSVEQYVSANQSDSDEQNDSDEQSDSVKQSGSVGQFVQLYVDYYRYNRSSFLRSVQRVFLKEGDISSLDDPVLITFPSGILAAAREKYSSTERYNSYPDFFGEILAEKDSKMIYSTDEKGRILSQTLYDEDDNVIWVINNTWKDERIISIVKEEGDNIYRAEYEYDSDGDRTLEKNYTNGILERVVRSREKTDIEELYLNGNVILQTVWEDGRKVSETRMR